VRILYFSDNGSDHNHRFLRKLVSLGNEVYFLDATQGESTTNLMPGVRSVRLKQRIPRDAGPGQYAGLVAEFQSLLADLRPDLVHAGPVQTCGYVAALSGFHPFVVMSWGSDLLVHADRNLEWKRATEITLGAADGFFCDCESVRVVAQRYAVIPDEKIVQFPWGIERGSFSPQGSAVSRESLGLTPDAFVFISTRFWEPLYDIDILLQAFNQAWRRNSQLRLLLLGNGSGVDYVRSFIADHELGGIVVAPGTITAQEMPRWFRSANAYVSCARSDGTSVSLLQAMATGLSVIVTDIASNHEWVAEDRNGWLAPPGSSEEFANKLLHAASIEPAHREAISECNRRIVAERADWDQNFPSLLRLYESLVGSTVEMKV
jgi:glycosyltransferase involved in cell wall biosynthesis